MTKPADGTDGSSAAGSGRSSSLWRTVDGVVSTLLTVVLICVDLFVGFLLLVGLGLSGNCTSSANCTVHQHVVVAVAVAAVLVVLSLAVGIVGLLRSSARRGMLIWWPLAGFALVLAAWAVVVSTD